MVILNGRLRMRCPTAIVTVQQQRVMRAGLPRTNSEDVKKCSERYLGRKSAVSISDATPIKLVM